MTILMGADVPVCDSGVSTMYHCTVKNKDYSENKGAYSC